MASDEMKIIDLGWA